MATRALNLGLNVQRMFIRGSADEGRYAGSEVNIGFCPRKPKEDSNHRSPLIKDINAESSLKTQNTRRGKSFPRKLDYLEATIDKYRKHNQIILEIN